MFGGEEMAARRDLGKRAKRCLGAVRSRLRAQFGNHLQHFRVGDEFLVGDAQPALEPPGGVDDHRCPTKQTPPEAKLVFIGGLHVVEIGG